MLRVTEKCLFADAAIMGNMVRLQQNNDNIGRKRPKTRIGKVDGHEEEEGSQPSSEIMYAVVVGIISW